MVQVRHNPAGEACFNVLLTEDREHAIEHWTQQLPRLLEPFGVRTRLARSGLDALAEADRTRFHAAVIDLLTPAEPHTPATRTSEPGTGNAGGKASGGGGGARPGGLWLLEVLQRRPNRPPIVVVDNGAYEWRRAQRYLNEALRLGAFTVISQPVDLESLLQAIRRLLDRRYAGHWPGTRNRNSSLQQERLP